MTVVAVLAAMFGGEVSLGVKPVQAATDATNKLVWSIDYIKKINQATLPLSNDGDVRALYGFLQQVAQGSPADGLQGAQPTQVKDEATQLQKYL